jgi:hypothetical protein
LAFAVRLVLVDRLVVFAASLLLSFSVRCSILADIRLMIRLAVIKSTLNLFAAFVFLLVVIAFVFPVFPICVAVIFVVAWTLDDLRPVVRR